MMIVKADRNYEAGAPPKPELMAAVGKLSEEMIKAGVLSSRSDTCRMWRRSLRDVRGARIAGQLQSSLAW